MLGSQIAARIKAERKQRLAQEAALRDIARRKFIEEFKRTRPKGKYGLSDEAREEMLAAQNGRCAICERRFKPGSRVTVACVDHCHKTGRVREFLCSKCNTGIGMFNDSADLLLRASGYLARHSTVKAAKPAAE